MVEQKTNIQSLLFIRNFKSKELAGREQIFKSDPKTSQVLRFPGRVTGD
jgi:hypothetical protein